jgi:HD-GYP domain-containing protein (c-di-GMP phosphodiesterase class II)
VAAMEAKDSYTKGHSENVRRYALKIARHLGLPEDRIRLIDFSSLLHDIGKMGVKEDILAKPAALSAREYEEVKQHPLIGSLMVSAIENLSVTGPIIRAHHEYYDGSGYPGGIKGDKIPIESRIISVADAFEAMTSDRPYRKAYGYKEALQRLVQASGTQFDREIVSAFVEMTIREGEIDGKE